MSLLGESLLSWDSEALEWMDERAALVADGCKLPQRCEEAERRAEALTREWDARGRDGWTGEGAPA